MTARHAARPRAILMFGPQGSGKGTQAELLAKRRKFVYLSTGEALRRELAAGSALGKLAQRSLRTGVLLSDSLVNRLVAKALAQPSARRHGVVLDGYPRNRGQAGYLDRHAEVTDVISLLLTDREAVRRIGGRRICSSCGRGYHTLSKPPKRVGICDACGGKLVTRPDDRAAAIRRRLQIFRRQTQPLLERYRARDLVREVDAAPPIAQVFRAVTAALTKRVPPRGPGHR